MWWVTVCRIGAVAWAAALVGCGGPVRTRPAEVAPWLSADPRRCLIPRDLSESMEEMARRCAETFVRENGYTAQPAADSTRWAREQEEGGPWPIVLGRRIGTLDREATTVQCSRRECVLLFRVRRPILLCAYRAVTMTQMFTRIHVAPGGIEDARCHERRV
jgi:hypothetical protein